MEYETENEESIVSGILICSLAVPVLVALAVGNDDIRELLDDFDSGCVHEIYSPAIVWFFEIISLREPVLSQCEPDDGIREFDTLDRALQILFILDIVMTKE